jgi:mRNA interferase MazF
MRRGALYRVHRTSGDSQPARVFVVVSRQPLIDSSYSMVICAPVFMRGQGMPTQVVVGAVEGLPRQSIIQCDGLMSLEKSRLTEQVGQLSSDKLIELDAALLAALGIDPRQRLRG